MPRETKPDSPEYVRLDGAALAQHGIRNHVRLPEYVSDKVGLNIRGVRALLDMMGIQHLAISNEAEEEVSFGIGGVNADGTASLAQATSVERLPEVGERFVIPINGVQPEEAFLSLPALTSEFYGTREALVRLDIDSVAKRILESGGAVVDEEKWAQELEHALKRQILKLHQEMNGREFKADFYHTLQIATVLIAFQSLIYLYKLGGAEQLSLGTHFSIPLISILTFENILPILDGIINHRAVMPYSLKILGVAVGRRVRFRLMLTRAQLFGVIGEQPTSLE